jgi:hypothetical protein
VAVALGWISALAELLWNMTPTAVHEPQNPLFLRVLQGTAPFPVQLGIISLPKNEIE